MKVKKVKYITEKEAESKVVEPKVVEAPKAKVLKPQHICVGILKARGNWTAKYKKLSLVQLNEMV